MHGKTSKLVSAHTDGKNLAQHIAILTLYVIGVGVGLRFVRSILQLVVIIPVVEERPALGLRLVERSAVDQRRYFFGGNGLRSRHIVYGLLHLIRGKISVLHSAYDAACVGSSENLNYGRNVFAAFHVFFLFVDTNGKFGFCVFFLGVAVSHCITFQMLLLLTVIRDVFKMRYILRRECLVSLRFTPAAGGTRFTSDYRHDHNQRKYEYRKFFDYFHITSLFV